MTDVTRTILVAGASTGIGRAITEHMLARDYRVIGLGRSIESSGITDPSFLPQTVDLTRLDELPDTVRRISARFPDIDGLICCAGQGRFGSLEEFSCRQIRELMDLNFTSHACLVRELLPALKRQALHRGQGHIIFIGSEAALQGGRRGAIYSASKFALRGFAQSLREECARSQLGVSIINPGMVRTGFFDKQSFRPGPDSDHAILADDVAAAVSMILNMRPGTVIDEINLSPLKKVIQFDADTEKKT
jgi:short-subunit dehydrogenase